MGCMVDFVNENNVTHGITTSPAPLDGALVTLTALGSLLDELVEAAGEAGWNADTLAEGWDVATQIAHLHWTDKASLAAIGDKAAFDALVEGAMADPEGFVDAGALELARLPREELVAKWREGRDELAATLEALDPGTQIAWFGPPMRPKSMATARIMETFAHGYDVADGLAAVPPGSPVDGRGPGFNGTAAEIAALPFVARIGHRTRNFSYQMNGEEPPAAEFGLALTAPNGDPVTFGLEDAEQTVTGSLRDFCLRVTQRIALRDTDLVATGTDAQRWLDLTQAFAGMPGKGRD